MKKSLVFIIAILAIMAASVSSIAQDINIEDMDNAQLIVLLQSIIQKLEEEKEPIEPSAEPVPTAAFIPTIEPEATAEPTAFQIYKNKKLIISKLPDYMFIPKATATSEPEELSFSSFSECDRYCYDQCAGYSDFYGIIMVDMGCYDKCLKSNCKGL